MNTKPETVTPTVAPTATVAPTEEVTPTEEAIATVTVAPTVTAPVVTEEPQYTPTTIPDTPTLVPTETPTPSPTPEPTATPIPTNTPTPVVKVDEKAKLLGTVKMGDNVWYDYYDDKTLVVRGKGKTKDLKESYGVYVTFSNEVSNLDVSGAKTIIIEEGITELGRNSLGEMFSAKKVVFPSTLKKIGDTALVSVGCFADNTEYIGLDVTKVEIAKTAFNDCGSPENVEGLKDYTALPTPTPAPTATPTPNPSKPRVYATRKMGDNVTFEFVDNGYLYIKGTGATYDKNWDFIEFRKEPYCNTHTVIVEEGVTYLGDHVFSELYEIDYYSLPMSLNSIGTTGGVSKGRVTFEGYTLDGKAITVRTPDRASFNMFFNVIKDIDKAIADGYEVTFR